jgi:Lysine/ornithine N-monooxygenase
VPQQNLAVIGAGPKAAALAAKAHCLQQEGVPVAVTVFERHEIGANWSGRNGYTDGIQRLCTPAERDLGYPYLPTFSAEIVEMMQSRFSWNAFQTAKSRPTGSYSTWVNHGRRPPSHRDFAEYLSFALDQASVTPNVGRVTGIVEEGGAWTIRQIEADTGDTVEWPGFDGVVFTGPGPAMKRLPTVADLRVFSGVDFWSRLRAVRKHMPKNREYPIVVIGGGGTAAAITAWFVRSGHRDQPIVLLNNQAMLFTRTTNFFESSLFDDDETWLGLSDKDRRDFTRRLNRGVVWETVTDLLADAEQLTLVPGKADEIRHSGHRLGAHSPDLEVRYTNARGSSGIDAGLVVDATGFDSWAFSRLVPVEVRNRILDGGHDVVSGNLRPDLSLPFDEWPRLHVPNLADALGPGFGSLMVLGSMADRILQPYVHAASA